MGFYTNLHEADGNTLYYASTKKYNKGDKIPKRALLHKNAKSEEEAIDSPDIDSGIKGLEYGKDYSYLIKDDYVDDLKNTNLYVYKLKLGFGGLSDNYKVVETIRSTNLYDTYKKKAKIVSSNADMKAIHSKATKIAKMVLKDHLDAKKMIEFRPYGKDNEEILLYYTMKGVNIKVPDDEDPREYLSSIIDDYYRDLQSKLDSENIEVMMDGGRDGYIYIAPLMTESVIHPYYNTKLL